MSDAQKLATVELLGALTYGQLRAFEVTARAVRYAPNSRLADDVATFAVREHGRYVALCDRLVELTDLGGAAMDRQKPVFDDFFDRAPVEAWLDANAFFAVGLPLAADFIREIAPTLDEQTARVVVSSLAGRDEFEEFAMREVRACMAEDEDGVRAHLRHVVADVLGRALTGFQATLADTDALHVLIGGAHGAQADDLVRRVAVNVLDGHRRRMHALGLEELDELD